MKPMFASLVPIILVAPAFGLFTSVAKAQTAGCGSGLSNTIINDAAPAVPIIGVDLTIGGKQFRVACDEHDACYDTYGRSKQGCDNAFRTRMRDICKSDHNTILGSFLREACIRRAEAFYTAVLKGGGTAYKKAQAAAKRAGYFDNGTTVFYANGTTYCGFVSPKHLDFFQQVNRAPSIGRQNPGEFGRDTGICAMPRGYFDDGRTVYYSLGNGTFCGFPTPPSLESHRNSRRQDPAFGRIDIDPSRLMANLGIC